MNPETESMSKAMDAHLLEKNIDKNLSIKMDKSFLTPPNNCQTMLLGLSLSVQVIWLKISCRKDFIGHFKEYYKEIDDHANTTTKKDA